MKKCETKSRICAIVTSCDVYPIHLTWENTSSDVGNSVLPAAANNVSHQAQMSCLRYKRIFLKDVGAEELEVVRREAEHIVARVINKASEIVQNGDISHSHIKLNEGKDEQLRIVVENEVEEEEEDEKMDDMDQLMKGRRMRENTLNVRGTFRNHKDPEIVEIAKVFVSELLDKAVDEANRRKEIIMKGTADDVCLEESMETGSIPSIGTKRKPWYQRASTSVSQFFHRMCLCMRSKNNR
uniref:Uncharacterized protein n=1 Tax=Strigamia maritima TaxID=126957 RepID=T1IRP1_STRMM